MATEVLGKTAASDAGDDFGEMPADEEVAGGEAEGGEDAVEGGAGIFDGVGGSGAGGKDQDMWVHDGPEAPGAGGAAAEEALVPGDAVAEALAAQGGGGHVGGGGEQVRPVEEAYAVVAADEVAEGGVDFVGGDDACGGGGGGAGGGFGDGVEVHGEAGAAVAEEEAAGGVVLGEPVGRQVEGEEAGLVMSPGLAHGAFPAPRRCHCRGLLK